MAAVGLALLLRFYPAGRRAQSQALLRVDVERPALPTQRAALLGILLFSLTLPSDWTQDIPSRYAKRHPGLVHSWLYPPVPEH